MAIPAGGPDVGMPSGVDREPGVVEGRAGPSGSGMAGGTRGWKSAGDVIGILDGGVIRLVARVTIGGHGEIVIADMARRAGRGDVNAGQWEGRFRVVEGSAGPVRGAMAQRTVLRETGGGVIGISGGLIFRQVA